MSRRNPFIMILLVMSVALLFNTVRAREAQYGIAAGPAINEQSPPLKAFNRAMTKEISTTRNDRRRPERPLDEQGGPDGFGYRFVDNTAGDTATFSWVELCGDPNAVDGPDGDEGMATATLSWGFPFYGNTYSSVFVSTNGWLVFGGSDVGWDNSCPFASAEAPQPMIAVCWDDLEAGPQGGCSVAGPWVRWRDFGNRVVIEWRDVRPWGDSNGHFTFEAILYPNGKIKLQYSSVVDPNNSLQASVGIDAPGLGHGVEYLECNVSTFPDGTAGRAVWFYPGPPPAGRCCYYGNPANPTCSNTPVAACYALGGVWVEGLNCTQNPCPASCVTCQPGDIIEPAEAVDPSHLDNDPNGGCGISFDGGNNLWGTIECGQTICGRCFSFTGTDGSLLHDKDGYQFTLFDSAVVHVTLEAAFSGAFVLFDMIDCDNFSVIDVQFAEVPCGTVQTTTACLGLAAGTYGLAVVAGSQEYLPVSAYRLSLQCAPCGTACGEPQRLTAFRGTGPASTINLRWLATQDVGSYKVWSTADPGNDGDPDNGADPDWTLIADVPAPVSAPSTLTATDALDTSYRNYVVVHDCHTTPPNENCQTAITLNGSLPISVSGSTIGATDDYNCQGLGEFAPACWHGPFYSESTSCAGPDVVYDWTVPSGGLYNFSLCGSGYNADLLIYNFTCPAEPSNPGDFLCGYSDNCPGGSFAAAINGLALNAGQRILIVVDGYGQTQGPFALTITQ